MSDLLRFDLSKILSEDQLFWSSWRRRESFNEGSNI